jgi:hypothetical protein
MKNLKKFDYTVRNRFYNSWNFYFKEDDIIKKLFLFWGLILLIRLLAFISDSVKSINKAKTHNILIEQIS